MRSHLNYQDMVVKYTAWWPETAKQMVQSGKLDDFAKVRKWHYSDL